MNTTRNHHTCTECNRTIPAGAAVLRGNGHRVIAYCRPCAVAAGVFVLPLPVVELVAAS
jgi:hypothetical protein